MSLARSERNYKEAKTIFLDVKDDFYQIENSEVPDEGYMIDQTLADVKKVIGLLGRIDTDALLDKYDFDTVDVIEKNVEKMREGSYFIEKSLMSMKMYDELRPLIGQYMKDVSWNVIADNQEDAETKFVNYLTSKENYDKYKTIVTNIVRGTMKKKAFADLFNSISGRIAKPKTPKKKYRHPVPPEMYPEEQRKEWEKEKERAKKDALKHATDEEPQEFDVMGESFVPLRKYKRK